MCLMYFLWQDNNNCSKSKNITPIHIILQNISSTTHIISKFCRKFKESVLLENKVVKFIGLFFRVLKYSSYSFDCFTTYARNSNWTFAQSNQTFKFGLDCIKDECIFLGLCKGREVEKNQILQFKLWFRFTHIGCNRVRILY